MTDTKKFHQSCQKTLQKQWDKASSSDKAKSKQMDSILALLKGKTKSFRYALVVQVLAKAAKPELDCRSLQLGKNKDKKSFDPRGMCDAVVVPFEREHWHEALGGSPEPYVNKPLRRARLSVSEVDSIRDKQGWKKLCLLLDDVEKMPQSEVQKVLADIVSAISSMVEEIEKTSETAEKKDTFSGESLRKILLDFLQQPSGGRRLQTVAYAYYLALKELGVYSTTTSSHVNVADAPSKRPADIVCNQGEEDMLCVEVKDKLLSESDVRISLSKTEKFNGQEQVFIVKAFDYSGEVNEIINRARDKGMTVTVLTCEGLIYYGNAIGGKFRLSWVNRISEIVDIEDRSDWLDLLQKYDLS